ncbi:MAG: FKBP-type peptidyl-prolyl cis-trans isomerase [Lachnospiraceae bacterium]|nr:FKBP-type peptidyl-prolyl cis-trans isomerase [Lachnospiraceae bacterium]
MKGRIEVNSKKNVLIIVASVMAIVAIALMVVIIALKNDDTDGDVIENDVTITPTLTVEQPTATDSVTPTQTVDKPTEKPTDAVTTEIQFTLGEYKGLKASYSPNTITDSDIDNNLKLLQEENSTVIDLPDRPFEVGDMAIVTYVGRVDGIVIDELYVDSLQVILGNNMVPTVMEEKIIGAKIGDMFEVNIDYPSDFTALKEIAGKTVTFTVELITGFTYYEPDITDSFIKENTDYSSVSEYRTKEKERLQSLENERAEEAVLDSLKRQVVDNCTFPSSVDNQVKRAYVLKLDEENNSLQETYMVDADTYYQYVYGYEPGEYAKKLMDSINYDTKYNYALDEIAKKESIEVTEAEFDEYFEKNYISEYGYSSKEQAYTELGEQQVKADVNTAVKRNKASQLIYDSAEIS